MEQCKYPDCCQEAHKTWSLVPLCKEHYDSIVQETHMYYYGKGRARLDYDEREVFLAIKPHIPWMKKGENHEVCRD